MPLIKSASPKARQENIRREVDSGKPLKQAVAIGYAVQRRAQGGDRGATPAAGKQLERRLAAKDKR